MATTPIEAPFTGLSAGAVEARRLGRVWALITTIKPRERGSEDFCPFCPPLTAGLNRSRGKPHEWGSRRGVSHTLMLPLTSQANWTASLHARYQDGQECPSYAWYVFLCRSPKKPATFTHRSSVNGADTTVLGCGTDMPQRPSRKSCSKSERAAEANTTALCLVAPHAACRGGSKVNDQNVTAFNSPPPRLSGWSAGS